MVGDPARARDEGRTVVLVTHDPRVAAGADRVLQLRDGLLVEETRLEGAESAAAVVVVAAQAGGVRWVTLTFKLAFADECERGGCRARSACVVVAAAASRADGRPCGPRGRRPADSRGTSPPANGAHVTTESGGGPAPLERGRGACRRRPVDRHRARGLDARRPRREALRHPSRRARRRAPRGLDPAARRRRASRKGGEVALERSFAAFYDLGRGLDDRHGGRPTARVGHHHHVDSAMPTPRREPGIRLRVRPRRSRRSCPIARTGRTSWACASPSPNAAEAVAARAQGGRRVGRERGALSRTWLS